jgi:hypothetical protein
MSRAARPKYEGRQVQQNAVLLVLTHARSVDPPPDVVGPQDYGR